VSNVISFTLKDGDKAYTARTYLAEGINPSDFTAPTLKRCVSHVINGMGAILSSLPPGSRLTLEAKPLKNYNAEKTKSAKGRKAKKKKSQNTGGRNSSTSKGAGQKAGRSK
jgi:hypothetical protein